MDSLTVALEKGKILVSDGAWGTMLMRNGLKAGECPELWNRNHPDRIRAVADAYVEAGADILETNSFGGNRIKLDQYGAGDLALELNTRAAELSKEAAGNDVLVMGSMGPTGKMLITGEISEAQMFDAFAEQGMGLQKGGADLLIIETMTDLQEASIAIHACLENTDLPLVCSMSFSSTGTDGYASMMGVTPVQFIETQQNSGILVLGSNCGQGRKEMLDIAKEFRKETANFPLLIQANAGIPLYDQGKTKFPDDPGDWKDYVCQLLELKINIIGGCCGTTPEFIRNIRRWVDEYLT